MPNPITTSSLIAVAGPSGSGKTTWISQFLKDANRPSCYLAPGAGNISVDLARIAYRFPWVRIIPENQIQSFFENWAEDSSTQTVIYWELGFHLVLEHPLLSALPWHRARLVGRAMFEPSWIEWRS
ncbi:MAG: hypothetical protein GC158_14820 [Cyanobacteria bacterium RI_101]|nr:hypothetical protein [Cyanobacteria bacterium RI_101]